jgi:hypothetical protein
MAIESLKTIIQTAGGQTALAALLRAKLPHRPLRQSHICNWLNSRNPDQMPPADYVPALASIAHDLGLSLSGRDLRPDLYLFEGRKAA